MLEKLQKIDSRWLYLLLFFAIAISLIPPHVVLPVIPSNQAQGVFEAIERAPTDKVALIGGEWSASTAGENKPQTIALFHHLMRRGIRFVIIGFDPQGPDNVHKVAESLAARYGYKYGRDWVNFGFRPYTAVNAVLKAFVRDIPGTADHDASGTKLTDTDKLPLMKKVHSMEDVGIIVEITPSDSYERWVAFVQGYKTKINPTGTPMVFAPTSVMAPEAYQYLDSGQIVGMLTGLKGAIEYEGLVHEPGTAMERALALSVTHILIVILIILGNLGFLAQKRRLKKEAGA